MTTQLNRPAVAEVHCQAVKSVTELLNYAKLRDPQVDTYLELQSVLEALPLPTEEYAKAINRLHNAHRYIEKEEWGAASYELAMLERSLVF